MRHLDEGTIHAWLDGALDAEEEQKAEAHAARCTECAVKVADARGMIAAASRILTALDDVPGGVLPQGSRAMPPVSASGSMPARRWPTWTMRIAASIAVVATGTYVVVRSGPGTRVAQVEQDSRTQLPPGVALKVTPAITPETTPGRREVQESVSNAPVSASESTQFAAKRAQPQPGSLNDKDAVAYAKAPDSQNVRVLTLDAAHQAAVPSQKPAEVASTAGAAAGAPAASAPMPATVAAAPAPALRAPADRLQSAPADSLKGAGADREAKKDANALAPSSASEKSKTELANAQPTGGRVNGLVAENLPPGMRLVSQQQTKEDAGVVERRVYELRSGVQVVLAILEPALGGAEARADANNEARDSLRRKLLTGASGTDEATGLNSIQWTDSTGAEFTLSGPVPLDSLRALRLRLPTKVQRQ